MNSKNQDLKIVGLARCANPTGSHGLRSLNYG
jgi:hypothetical protein